MHRTALALLLTLTAALPLAAVDETPPDEVQENRARLAALRKDPQNQGRLRRLEQEARAFLALPPAQQERLRKLDRDLHAEPSASQKRHFEVMGRYADWLDRLPLPDRRAVLQAPDAKARLERIKDLRETEWIERQPRAWRDALEAARHAGPAREALAAARGMLRGPLTFAAVSAAAAPALLPERALPLPPGKDLRARLLAAQRQAERDRRQRWQLATRHWEELRTGKPMPTRLADFEPAVEAFVKEYLRPLLTPEERDRLDRAEGQWPLFPATLVELADRHPIALQGNLGPMYFKDLPSDVREQLTAAVKKPKGSAFPPAQLKAAEGAWPRFGIAVADFISTWNAKVKPKWVIKLRYELWPTRLADLSPAVQEFVKTALAKRLDPEEAEALKKAEGRWPDYPRTIQVLAARHYLTVPWQTLPGPRERWDPYRLLPQARLEGFPDVPRQKLFQFALATLTPQQRAALRLGEGEAGWRVLAEEYFRHHPDARERTRQQDFRGPLLRDAFLTAPQQTPAALVEADPDPASGGR